VARIARALNEAGVPCPSASDPVRNPHRTGTGWSLGTVATILSNPRYTGRQVWNRQRTDRDLADPADVSLGHKSVQRWNLPDGWVISRNPAYPALVSEADFIAAQDISAARGPAPAAGPAAPRKRRYLLARLLVCGGCGRRMESAWSNGKPAYRCRHGHTSASRPGQGRAKNASTPNTAAPPTRRTARPRPETYLLPGVPCPCCGTVTFADPPPGLHAGAVPYGPALNAAAVPVSGEKWPWGDPHAYPYRPHPVGGNGEVFLRGAAKLGSPPRSARWRSSTAGSATGRTASTAASACRAARSTPLTASPRDAEIAGLRAERDADSEVIRRLGAFVRC
jgi:hypothetical protein